jgi:hypothetical protein
MVSLEKTLKKDPWDANTIMEYYGDTQSEGTHKDKAEWLPLEQVLLDLKNVAQQILQRRDDLVEELKKQPYPQTKTNSLIIQVGITLLDWFLGLLVEQEGEPEK